ncbi:MAG: hypothetical protein L3K15_09305 [Thermoplasmata archaeon]|nr:hypothetical protein [Thermoplasmata archaeon]
MRANGVGVPDGTVRPSHRDAQLRLPTMDWGEKLDQRFRRDRRRRRTLAWLGFLVVAAVGIAGLALVPWPSDHGWLILWIGTTVGLISANLRMALEKMDAGDDDEYGPLPPGPFPTSPGNRRHLPP